MITVYSRLNGSLAGSRSVIVGPKLMINIISDVGSGQKMAFQFQFKYGPLAEMLYNVDLPPYLHVVQCQ